MNENPLPDWLNNEFLEKALNSSNESNLKVISSEITNATAPGDNYGSHIYRATINISRNGLQEKLSVIIKAEVFNPELKKVMSELNAFEREINAFTVAIPQLQNLLQEKAVTNYQPYAAKCYYTSKDTPIMLVLEDLKEAGFRLANPSQVLDTKHCLLVVNTLATYHAASAVLNNRTSHKLEQVFEKGLYNTLSQEMFDLFFKPMLTELISIAQDWPECQGDIINKLRLIEENLRECLKASTQINETDFGVFAHLDVWVNNLMFHYSEDTKEVDAIRFVDFQGCQWTSPVLDLLYFINANAALEHVKNPQQIIDEYYRRLKETLAALGCVHLCPSKEYLHQQFDKRCKFGVVLGLVARSGVLMNRSDAETDASKVLKNEMFVKLSEAYKKDARKMLSIFNDRGWL
ncbi:hypothetical protein L9F63_022901 [Diploptera punctata]|uniref:CHK kinase-like domain-containing protein n=1 Tax=Diploptera punctata TaxID=6984 RepID=A0AAD7ZLV9_DIPPU|nr:hypothetical protein L9F63_022901 [Diploptera punctata]